MKFTSPASNHLIVDFPSRIQSQNNRSGSLAGTMSVRFDPVVKGQYVKYSSAKEQAAKWYSCQDKKNFERAMIQDAIICSYMMAMSAMNLEDETKSTVEERVIRSVGLDRLISMDSNVRQRYEANLDARRKHTSRVLEAQRLLKTLVASHGLDVDFHEDLAHVSEVSSQASQARAGRIAKMMASIK